MYHRIGETKLITSLPDVVESRQKLFFTKYSLYESTMELPLRGRINRNAVDARIGSVQSKPELSAKREESNRCLERRRSGQGIASFCRLGPWTSSNRLKPTSSFPMPRFGLPTTLIRTLQKSLRLTMPSIATNIQGLVDAVKKTRNGGADLDSNSASHQSDRHGCQRTPERGSSSE